MPKALNATSLVLIPKHRGADKLKDFRPISCLNTLITRLLSDRLKIALPEIILPNQTAFIKDRLLLENVLLAAEVINGYRRKDISPRITLKIDIAKAFDSMRWDFILLNIVCWTTKTSIISYLRPDCVLDTSLLLAKNG